jgi:hypothetical protein
MKQQFLHAMLAGLSLLALSCATTSTQIASSWKSQEQFTPPQRILVIGVAPVRETRTLFESQFAEKLNSHGVTAYPSYTIFTSTGITDKAALTQVIQDRNIDTVLLTRIVEQKDVTQYVPGTGYSPASPFYGDWYGYYGSVYYYNPGYTIENKVVVLQTNLYDAARNALIWSATSDTTTQGNRAEVVKSFITAMTRKMQKDKLIK